ncbi:P44/Msp2 family outer membrane protein [Wolbachia endosymbiont of Mansonella perstans]|uniref:P44/Msp2 family outer membrane protein n=1 Tax=Wolbachia endosymbiont of Mansonella perstans TaxID=229526 RepID=UPI001CE0635E|nr:P44/Msp2 family outer membrane protein [Wolbachia endosymbiont of Mansonella perstans]MCA4774069.1 P44/Msp2 family outer membrane protein [Wolbachia endosymbiont of Mansonella perstans]
MHYKKFFSATALVTLLSLSSAAFSDPVGPIADEETNYYIRLQYNGELLPFKTEIKGIEYKKGNEDQDPLKASFIAGGGAFGYKMDDIRVDIEGLYSQLSKNDIKDATFTPDAADNLTAISGLVNVYYDVAIEDMPITPYVGVGLGTAYLSNPSKADAVKDQKGFGFAYQAKAGISYDVTPEIKLFAGARYFGSYGAKFDATTKDDGKIKVLYSTIGAEAGVAFNF